MAELDLQDTGLVIQTDELEDCSIYFYDVRYPDTFDTIIDEPYSVRLEMLRGLNDKFYYALRDDGAASDTLYKLAIEFDKDHSI